MGASDRVGSLGRLPVEFLQRYGYSGGIFPIRPDGAAVCGLPSYSSVQAVPEPVDLAMIMVSAERTPAAIDECIAAGVRVAIVCSSGFAETGEAGSAVQDEMVAKAAAAGLRVVGPNCIGSVGVANRQVTSFSPMFAGEETTLVDGGLGFVSQSGALGYGAVSLAFERGLGLGWVVNTGNEADVTGLDVMVALADEPGCTGLLGYLESLNEIAPLREVVAQGVPVAVLKAGRSDAGQRAAASHTGALATGDRIIDAALRQLGVVRVDDVDELLDVGDAFSQPRRPSGPGVAVVTTSGGSGILTADAIEMSGLRLAELSDETVAILDAIVPAYGATANPVDVTATVMSDSALFDRAIDALVDDDAVDMVIACFCVLTGQDVHDVVASLARAASRGGKPILAARTGANHLAPEAAAMLRAAGIPTYPTPARAVRAAAALHRVTHRPSPPPADSTGQAVATPPDAANEHVLKQMLREAGLAVPAGRIVTTASDAAAAVSDVGGRAVMKAVVPGVTHKSEAGAVALDVTPETAPRTFSRLAALGGSVLVEEMVTGGVEVLVGVTSTSLGHVLTVGPGGVLTEVLDDVALRLLPVDRDQVEGMLDETRLGVLLSGVRGAEPADRAALVDTILRVAGAVTGWPDGFELDLNPVAVLPHGSGTRILDAAYVLPETQH